MQNFKPWTTTAINRASRSENPIHEDRAAQRMGFRAGLVPGATLFAYLVHPAVTRWREDWIDRGRGSILLSQPCYEGDGITVAAKADGPRSYGAELRTEAGGVHATGTASVPDQRPEPPVQRDDPPARGLEERPIASRLALERLKQQGMGSVRISWRGEPPYDRYCQDLDEMPTEIRPDQRAFANPAFVLNLANVALTANLRLGPWIHTESELQNFGRLPLGRSVNIESSIIDLFERSGHEFCDLQVNVFLKEGPPIASIRHRAIYRPRA